MDMADALVILVLHPEELIFIRHKDEVIAFYLDSFAPLKVLRNRLHPKIIHIFAAKDVKRLLVGFVCHGIETRLVNHHLRACHIVVHHIFKVWLKGVLVN